MEINKTLFEKYEKAMANEEILEGVVRFTQHNKDLDTPILVLDLQGVKAIIPKDEVDYEMNWKSLVGFVGRKIYFIVKEIDRDNSTIICSRKAAQIKIKPELIERLQKGETFEATVVNHLDYAGYVDIKGITGLLKNEDFASDYSTVKNKLKIGDTIEVRLKKTSTNNKIIFEAVTKYKDPTIMDFSIFERDQVMLGTVVNVIPSACFINVAPQIDVLCPIPETIELDKDMKVKVKIKVVDKENQRLRGKVIKLA